MYVQVRLLLSACLLALPVCAQELKFADLGDFDHLAYSAGESLVLMALADLDIDDARDFFAVRYFGTLRVLRAAAPRIRPGGDAPAIYP